MIFSISSDDELATEACAHVGNRDIILYHLDRGAPLSLPTAVAQGEDSNKMVALLRENGARR